MGAVGEVWAKCVGEVGFFARKNPAHTLQVRG